MATAPTLTQQDGTDNIVMPDAEQTAPEQDEQDAQANYGPNNEKLPQDIVSNLVTLARKFCEEDRYSRRLEIQESRRARFYWRGMQHLYWDYKNEGWQIMGPGGASVNSVAGRQDNSAILYNTNIYQGFGLSICAVLTQNLPTVRFEPQDVNEAADVTTANAAQRLKKIIEHENDAVKLLTVAAYYAWTDGRVGAWTRWGMDKRTQHEREMIQMAGALELKVPITTECIDEYVYLQFSDEFHQANIRAEVKALEATQENPDGFPAGYSKKIKGGASGNGQDVYERTARISTKQGVSLLTQSGDTLSHLVTRQRTWMRPSAFEMLEDEAVKDQVEEIFPDGCHIRIDNGVYTGSWNESMDDHWSVMHPMPGDGQFRNGLGTSLVSVQERFNDIVNITQDVYEKTIPAGWVDDRAVDADGTVRQVSNPGARYPFPKVPNEPIADSFFFEPDAHVSPDMLQYAQDLMGPIAQFLTGAFPALFGGNTGSNDTASGIAQQRDQAMGRIGLPWRMFKRFWANIMQQAVRLSAKYRDDDISIGIPDENGNVETTEVRIEEMQGKVFCYPESDEGFPESWTQKRATYMALLPMADKNPVLAATLQQPDNQEQAHQLIGLEDFKIPGADSRNKQMTEINLLLKEGPIPGQPVPTPNPMTGQVEMQPGPPQPSVQIDPQFDDNAVEFETGKGWINSADGQKAKQENPEGFMNVRLHLLMHQQAMQAAMQPPPPPPAKVSINIPLDKMPPEAIAQELQKQGITTGPNDFLMQHQMEVTKKPSPPVIQPKV